ncbi:MAG: nucleotidyl transferase AbiEii/AbiGii toxin family protein [Verrucomicrobia bacterium]|nr:nucleotidyl transferase AbiEii/AbiGii toxin family protein [Verrucomicrobiota bacterium]
MNEIALLSREDRRALFTETGARKGLPPFHVEKDFWVCWVLSVLFQNPKSGPNLTFRGGTSLSKAWGIVERFSEDIDLAMSREWLGKAGNPAEAGITSSEKERRLKALREECREMIAGTLLPILGDAAKGLAGPDCLRVDPLEMARDPFCLYFEYPGTGLQPPADYNRAVVKVELSGRADGWPMADRTIRPYAAEAFPKETGDPILTLSCVRPERTFWEKAALIHEQNVRSGDRALAARQARHLADLVQLWRAGVSRAEGFASLFEGVKHHRQTYFDYKWVDYDALGAGDLKIVPPDSRLAEWRADYEAMRAMFHGEPPGFDEMVAELCAIEERLSRLAS